jgi:hypothetical protein
MSAPQIDLSHIAKFAALDYRESVDQVDNMERNKKFTAEEVQKRRGRLADKAQAVEVLQVVAGDQRVAEYVAKKLAADHRGDK